jgi:hypothetical protein
MNQPFFSNRHPDVLAAGDLFFRPVILMFPPQARK